MVFPIRSPEKVMQAAILCGLVAESDPGSFEAVKIPNPFQNPRESVVGYANFAIFAGL
jgi:hypothetical protein